MSLDVSYQHMSGETWVDNSSVFSVENGYFKENEESKSLLAKLSLNVSKIPKLKIAEAYYERTNDIIDINGLYINFFLMVSLIMLKIY